MQHQDKFDRRRGGEEKARKLFSSLSLSLSILFTCGDSQQVKESFQLLLLLGGGMFLYAP